MNKKETRRRMRAKRKKPRIRLDTLPDGRYAAVYYTKGGNKITCITGWDFQRARTHLKKAQHNKLLGLKPHIDFVKYLDESILKEG